MLILFSVDGKDYNGVDTILIFETCASRSSSVNVPIINDEYLETNETMKIELSEPNITIEIDNTMGGIKIFDDNINERSKFVYIKYVL